MSERKKTVHLQKAEVEKYTELKNQGRNIKRNPGEWIFVFNIRLFAYARIINLSVPFSLIKMVIPPNSTNLKLVCDQVFRRIFDFLSKNICQLIPRKRNLYKWILRDVILPKYPQGGISSRRMPEFWHFTRHSKINIRKLECLQR